MGDQVGVEKVRGSPPAVVQGCVRENQSTPSEDLSSPSGKLNFLSATLSSPSEDRKLALERGAIGLAMVVLPAVVDEQCPWLG